MEEFLTEFKGKSVAVLGLGVSNTPLVELLCRGGAQVCVRDAKDEEKHDRELLAVLKSKGAAFKLGDGYLEGLCEDYIFRSPGIRFDRPEIASAVAGGSVLTSEIEFFFKYFKGTVIAVTGSDGKTTTTTLTYKMLKQAGVNCYLGGNIGTPLVSFLGTAGKDSTVVAELSSFQLHTLKQSPHIALVTNVTPNHLDYHKGFEEYVEAKENIFAHQTEGDILVINGGDGICREYATKAAGKVKTFTVGEKPDCGAYIKDGVIYYSKDGEDTEIMSRDDILLRGDHNVQNYLAAITAVYDMVTREDIVAVARTFTGVEHRLQLVREVGGVKFYNSSIDSSPTRTIAALSTFEEKIILIAGGKDKGIPYDELGPHLAERVKVLILTGPTAEKIHQSLLKTGKADGVKVIYADDFEDVAKIAYQNAAEGDCVLLSPASTSFDRFKNFAQRGETFCRLVNEL